MKPFVSALVQPITKWLPQGVGYKYNGHATGLMKSEQLALVVEKKGFCSFSILCFARRWSVRILFLFPLYSKSWVSILTGFFPCISLVSFLSPYSKNNMGDLRNIQVFLCCLSKKNIMTLILS